MSQELIELPDLFEDEYTDITSTKSYLPIETVNDDGLNLLLYEKDFFLDPNLVYAALFNWTEQVIFEKTINFRHRTVNIVGAAKSQEQLSDELKRLTKSDKNVNSVKQLQKQLPICGDFEARMYFAILKIFYQQAIDNKIPRKIITTYQEIKQIMGLTPTYSTTDLRYSLFRLAHTRYDFKDSFKIAGTESAALVKQTHSLYLLNYYELEISKLKEKINLDEGFEDRELIENTLNKLFNKRGKPTSNLLRITLDEEVWKNLSNGYGLLYSYEHLKEIPKAVARGLYLFLDPSQGILFKDKKIIKTNIPNVFTVKALHLVEYLGSSETNPSKSLGRINKALDLLKNEGYIKDYSYVTSTRKILDGVYNIEFFSEQSRSQNNKYVSFMVRANPKALTVPIIGKSKIDIDYEEVLEKFYRMVGGEELLTPTNKNLLRSIYYDEDNIKIVKLFDLQMEKTYGYYFLSGIIYGASLVKAKKNANSLIKAIISAESNQDSNKAGYKIHAIELIAKDFKLKYGEDKFEELSSQARLSIQDQFLNNTIEHSDQGYQQEIWEEFVSFYLVVYNVNKCETLDEFNNTSRIKLIKEYLLNKFYSIKLANYVILKAKDVNAYLAKDGVNGKHYISKEDAEILRKSYEEKIKQNEKDAAKQQDKNKKSEDKKEQYLECFNRWKNEFNVLKEADKERFLNKANRISERNVIKHCTSADIAVYLYALSMNDSNKVNFDPTIKMVLDHLKF